MSKIQQRDTAALDRLRHRREKQIAACNSHAENDLYMDKFTEGLHRLKIADGAQKQSDAFNNNSERIQHAHRCSKSSSIRALDVSKDEVLQAHACKKAPRQRTEYHSHLPGTVADGWIAGPVNETGE